MKVYLVYKDNGQDYEDYYEDVVKVFNDKRKAQYYIKKKRLKKKKQKITME